MRLVRYAAVVGLSGLAWSAVAACSSSDAGSSDQPQTEGGTGETGTGDLDGGEGGSETGADGPVVPGTVPDGLSLVAGGLTGDGDVDGVGIEARLMSGGVALDPIGKALFMPQAHLRRLQIDTQAVTTLLRPRILYQCTNPCDDGPAGVRSTDVAAFDPGTQKLYIAGERRIRELDLATGTYTTIVGVRAGGVGGATTTDGNGATARFKDIYGMAIDATTHRLYVTTANEPALRIVDLTTNDVTTAWAALPTSTTGKIVFDGDHTLFVARDTTVSVVDVNIPDVVTTHTIPTVPFRLTGLGYDAANKKLYASHGTTGTAASQSLLLVDTTAWTSTVIPNTQGMAVAAFVPWKNFAIAVRETELFTVTATAVTPFVGAKIVNPGSVDGTAGDARFNSAGGIAYDTTKRIAYVSDEQNKTIRAIDLPTRKVTTFAGVATAVGSTNGPRGTNLFGRPRGLAVDEAAHKLYVADGDNREIRMVDTLTGEASTVVGDVRKPAGIADGPKSAAVLRSPTSLVLDVPSHTLFFTDGGGNVGRRMIRAVDTQSLEVRTIFGNETNIDVIYVSGLAYDAATKTLYVAGAESEAYLDGGAVIFAVDIATGVKTAVAGTFDPLTVTPVDGDRATARFSHLLSLTFDTVRKRLYVRDRGGPVTGATVRTVDPATGAVVTLTGSPERAGQRTGPLATGAMKREGSALWIGDGDLLITDYNALLRAKGF